MRFRWWYPRCLPYTTHASLDPHLEHLSPEDVTFHCISRNIGDSPPRPVESTVTPDSLWSRDIFKKPELTGRYFSPQFSNSPRKPPNLKILPFTKLLHLHCPSIFPLAGKPWLTLIGQLEARASALARFAHTAPTKKLIPQPSSIRTTSINNVCC